MKRPIHPPFLNPPGRVLIAFIFLFFLPSPARANCLQNSAFDAPTLYYDATTSLNLTGYASVSGRTDYPGTFDCSTPAWGIIGGKNSVDNSSPYAKNTLYLKFPGNAYVSLSVTDLAPEETHPKVGTNNATTIDASFTVNLKLLKTIPSQNVMTVNGDTAIIRPIVLAQDSTGLTIIQNIARLVGDFAYFIFHWSWPRHDYDIYYKPMQIKFIKRVTTCSFDDDNKIVRLNNISLPMLANGNLYGKAFELNFTCTDLQNGVTSRSVLAYLSSNNVSTTDNTTLISPDGGSAGGVGIRVYKNNTPIKFSPSATDQGDATALFSFSASQPLAPKLSIPLTAWYHVYDAKALSSGPVRTTAVVNFVYD